MSQTNDENRALVARGRLAEAFRAQDDSAMAAKARSGWYGDFTSPLAFPITELVRDCQAKGYHAIAERAMSGDFDG
jgi:hypothetical protein